MSLPLPFPRAASFLGRRLCQVARRKFAGAADKGVLDNYHINPMGESDMPMRSRISRLSDDMMESKLTGVRGLSCVGFRMMDGIFLYGPVALFPRSALSWRVLTPDDITPESLSLFALLEPKIDILVLGVGDKKNIDKVRARVVGFLKEHKIGLEISDTEDAISTFNWLNAEGRCVAAALYPPDDMVVTDAEHGRALNLLKAYDTIDEHPFLVGLVGTGDEEEDLVRRVWGGDTSWAEIKAILADAKKGEKEAPKIGDK